jgi:hypothetical protein
MQEEDGAAARIADLLPVHDVVVGERQVAGLVGADFGEEIAAGHGLAGGREGRKRFFFEKKKQKTFVCWGLWRWRCHNPQDQKFFGSFFQKRTSFLPLARFWIAAPLRGSQ